MARLTDEIENGQRVVHVENEDEFYYYFDRGPITLSHELADSLGFREGRGGAEELDVEEWEETLKGERGVGGVAERMGRRGTAGRTPEGPLQPLL